MINILYELEEHAGNYDLQAMDAFVESLSPAELEKNKQAIIKNYNMVFASGMYDLDCDTVTNRESFIFFLLLVISSVQRFFPDQPYYEERGRCYGNLADCAAAYEDKLNYIQHAIHIYNTAPQTTSIQMSMVRALINKMETTRQFTPEAFTELLSFFRPVLNDATFVKALVYQCFRVRSLPFEQNLYWHQCLLGEFEDAMHEAAQRNLLVYLDWAEAYHSMLSKDAADSDADYKATMVAQAALLLKPLEGYYTEDADLLYRLGDAFENTAKRSTDNNLSVAYYKTAIDFFKKSHERQRHNIWDFPVYAINALLDLAYIYHKLGDHENVINTFEHGLQLFSQANKHEDDFTLNLYWGNFLIEYTALAYDYQSSSINSRAEEKLHLAIVQEGRYHTHPSMSRPYFFLARLAIKTGDKEKCVTLLLQCREAIRSRGYVAYDLDEALADEDFREIWDQLRDA